VLFALPEYSAAARETAYMAIEALAVARSALLSKMRKESTEAIPVSRFTSADGEELEILPTAVRVPLSVDIPSVVSGDLGSLRAALDAAAEEQEKAIAHALFSGISELTDYTGNKVDAGGRPISWDLITDTLEKMEIAFDEDGKMDLTLVVHPDTAKKLEELGPPTPEQQARYDAVLETKRQEWQARKRQRRLR
jgi:hypothetical protein